MLSSPFFKAYSLGFFSLVQGILCLCLSSHSFSAMSTLALQVFLAVSFYFCFIDVRFSDTTEDIRKCGILVLIIALGHRGMRVSVRSRTPLAAE